MFTSLWLTLRLPFGAVYSDVFCSTAACFGQNDPARVVRLNQTTKSVARQRNSDLERTIKLHKAEGSCRGRW